jgi:methylated-DNA-protein-cysteine methyltransferase-like protein
MTKEVQEVVWRIPRGKVATYGQVAEAAGFPGAARRVARALRAASPDFPWFRVLGAGGWIRLPGESGLEQRIRLAAEGVQMRGMRVQMDLHAIETGTIAPRTIRRRAPRRAAARKL